MDTTAVDEWLGEDPQQVADKLQSFEKSCAVLSDSDSRLVEQYPDKWVGIHDGEVKADSDALDTLLAELDAQRIPRDNAIVRFISVYPDTLIL